MDIKNMPIVSVIMPVYNCEEYLPKAIESVLNQTYKNYELILVDDGSTDNSGNICDSYAADNKKVHSFHKENGGPGSARNEGINQAKGEYILFVDGDDVIDNDVIEELLLRMTPSVDMVCMNFDIVDAEGNVISKSNYQRGTIHTAENKTKIASMFFSDNFGHSVCTRLYRREIISKFSLTFPDTRLAEDCYFVFLYLLCINRDICVIEKNGYHYLIHSNSIMRGEENRDQLAAYLDLGNKINNFIKEKLFYTEYYDIKPLLYVFFLRPELLKIINRQGPEYLKEIWDNYSELALLDILNDYLIEYKSYYKIIEKKSIIEMRNIISFLFDGKLLRLRIRNRVLYFNKQ